MADRLHACDYPIWRQFRILRVAIQFSVNPMLEAFVLEPRRKHRTVAKNVRDIRSGINRGILDLA
jgi:hypothetical protein